METNEANIHSAFIPILLDCPEVRRVAARLLYYTSEPNAYLRNTVQNVWLKQLFFVIAEYYCGRLVRFALLVVIRARIEAFMKNLFFTLAAVVSPGSYPGH